MKKLLLMLVIVGLMFTCSDKAQALTIFSDGFDASISGWTINTTGTATVTSGTGFGIPYVGDSTNYAVIDLYRAASLSMERTISTAGYNNIHLSYYRRDLNSEVPLVVEWMPSGGSWSLLESYTTNTWNQVDWDLSGLNSVVNNSNMSVRFSLTHGDSGNHYRDGVIEDVLLTGKSITVTPEPASMALLGLGLAGLARMRKKELKVKS